MTKATDKENLSDKKSLFAPFPQLARAVSSRGALNPARDLGPRIAHFLLPIPGKGSSDWGYAWIPVVGPLLGGLLGSFLFWALW